MANGTANDEGPGSADVHDVVAIELPGERGRTDGPVAANVDVSQEHHEGHADSGEMDITLDIA